MTTTETAGEDAPDPLRRSFAAVLWLAESEVCDRKGAGRAGEAEARGSSLSHRERQRAKRKAVKMRNGSHHRKIVARIVMERKT